MNAQGNPGGPSQPMMMPMQFPYPMMMPMFMTPTTGMAPGMMPGMFGYSPYQGLGVNIGQNAGNGQMPGQTELPQAYKTKKHKAASQEEYIERFNTEVLPKLGYKRLAKLQAAVRGWYARRVIVPRKKMWAAILEDYVAKKTDEFVEDTLVPDLVLEVLNENSQKRNYDLYSTKFRGEIQYVDGFVERVVQKMAREAVQETISGIAGDFLRKKGEKRETSKDPIELLSIDWLEAFVRKEARDVAETSLHEMTDLYIIESQFITFFRRKLLKDRIRGALKEAVDEMLCEHFVNKAIAKILEDIAEPLALLGAEEEFYEREGEEIEKGFDDLILRNIMEEVVENLAERLGDKNYEYIADQAAKYNKFKDFTEEFINEVMMVDNEDK